MDGAVVLDSNLTLRGFGAIIADADPDSVPPDVKEAAFDAEGSLSVVASRGSGGTRHRSAARFADQNRCKSLAFVASQDGLLSLWFGCRDGTVAVIRPIGPFAHSRQVGAGQDLGAVPRSYAAPPLKPIGPSMKPQEPRRLTRQPRLRFLRKRTLDAESKPIAQRAFLVATELLSKAAGLARRKARNSDSEVSRLKAELQAAELRAHIAERTADLLRARWLKIPSPNRPRYDPHQRFEALQLRHLAGWNRNITAERFAVSPGSVSNWEAGVDEETETVGTLVKPVPPVTRIADVTRSLVQTMHCAKFGASFAIASTISRAGWEISERSVGRIRAEAFLRAPLIVIEEFDNAPLTQPVITRFVHHTWMLDLSPFHTLGGAGDLWLGGVFDAHTRTPLVLQTYASKPGAHAMASLFKVAVARFQKPNYVITDLGGEFKGAFKKTVKRFGCGLRRASKENLHATARLERFWRTLKQLIGYRISFPADIHDLDARLAPALAFYLQKSHKGLVGQAPLDAFKGILAKATSATRAPRGVRGEGPKTPPVRVSFLDPARQQFPFLVAA